MRGKEETDEQYFLDDEYRNYFPRLNGLRRTIASDLPVRRGTRVLHLATRYGYFALEVAKLDSSLKIIGIDISQSDILNSRDNIEKENLADRIEIIQMDSTSMRFLGADFDAVVNFLRLEDIHVTRRKEGVQKTFLEVNRVLKPGGCFCFVVMPPDQMETKAQKTEVAIFSYICGATWLNCGGYEHMLKKSEFELMRQKSYCTGKKLSPEQAMVEVRFACENVPAIYGINTPSFEEVWARFGRDIEETGMGHYSKVVSVIAEKIGEAK